jgi:FkbM family methyltransferase
MKNLIKRSFSFLLGDRTRLGRQIRGATICYEGHIRQLNYLNNTMFVSAYDDRYFLISQNAQLYKINFLVREFERRGFSSIIDLGANYGEFSLPFCDVAKEVIAVEPNPFVLFCLKLSCRGKSNIKIIGKAIDSDDRGGELSIAIDPFASGGGTASPTAASRVAKGFRLDGSKSELFYFNAKTTTLEKIISDISFEKMACIKIDIEGLELSVIGSSTNAINSLSDYLIFFESMHQERHLQYIESLLQIKNELNCYVYSFNLSGMIREIFNDDFNSLIGDRQVTELILSKLPISP